MEFVLLETKKPACPLGDVDDVTLGSPAVFNLITLMTDPVSKAKRSVAFRPLFTKGLALKEKPPYTHVVRIRGLKPV